MPVKNTRYTVCNTDNHPLKMIFTNDILFVRFFTFVLKIVVINSLIVRVSKYMWQ